MGLPVKPCLGRLWALPEASRALPGPLPGATRGYCEPRSARHAALRGWRSGRADDFGRCQPRARE
eukprot:777544-Pyramimonas_sp.AAC.1